MSFKQTFLFAVGLGITSAACAANTDAVDEEAVATDDAAYRKGDITDASTYFIVKPDYRRCMYPMCGGYFVKRVNGSKTKCSDGKWQDSCYVVSIDTKTETGTDIHQLDAARLVLRGDFAKADAELGGHPLPGTWSKFDATEAWIGDEKGADHTALWNGKWWANGIFYRYALNGVRCFRAPCPSIDGVRLNSGWVTSITDFGGPLALGALNSMGTGSILGSAWTHYGKDGARTATLQQYYTKLQAEPPTECKRPTVTKAHPMYDRFEAPSFKNDCTTDKDCMVGGCSGEVCAAEGVITTCEVLAEHPSGGCGCLAGKCQWNEKTFCGTP